MSDTKDYLRGLMERYTTEHLDPLLSERDFRMKLSEFIALDDWKMEGYTSPNYQRTKSIAFEWGHNHDFGTFKLEGVLGDRHIDILAEFIDDYGLPRDLSGKKVLDVGVWCGGTSLLLAAMGASVEAIEEVSKYAQCTEFLAKSFSAGIEVMPYSLYLAHVYGGHFDYFDYIIFPGVLYHLTDPILALRILFNALKDGGELFIETAGELGLPFQDEAFLRYGGSKDGTSSWFIPSQEALWRMLRDVGFATNISQTVTIGIVTEDNRMFAVAKRTEWRDMLRAGLSRPNIR